MNAARKKRIFLEHPQNAGCCLRRYGSPGVKSITDVDRPAPKDGEVLVEVNCYTLEETAEALRYVDSGHPQGKQVQQKAAMMMLKMQSNQNSKVCYGQAEPHYDKRPALSNRPLSSYSVFSVVDEAGLWLSEHV